MRGGEKEGEIEELTTAGGKMTEKKGAELGTRRIHPKWRGGSLRTISVEAEIIVINEKGKAVDSNDSTGKGENIDCLPELIRDFTILLLISDF